MRQELSSNKPITWSSALTQNVNSAGVGFNQNNVASGATITGTLAITTGKCTFVAVLRRTASNPYNCVARLSTSGGYLLVNNGNGTGIGITVGGVGDGPNLTLQNNVTYVVVASMDGSTYYVTAKPLAGGAVIRTSGSFTNSASHNGTAIVLPSASPYAFSGEVNMIVAGFAFIPESKARLILDNPFRCFEPRTRRTIIDLGTSGLSSVYADSALTYYIRSLLSSDSGIQYAIRNAIYKDDAVGYYLRSAIAQNSEVGYVLRSAIAKDDAEAYKIRGLVQSSDAETYSIRGLVQTSDSEAYKIRSQVQADTSTSYDIQSSTSVASSNAVNYSVRGAVAASAALIYSVRGSVQKDTASAYSVRSAVSRDVVASYSVSAAASSVYADSTASYSVDGVVPSGPSAESIAAAVLAALQGTTIPVNIKQVNDVTVQGAGTKLNPWQPV